MFIPSAEQNFAYKWKETTVGPAWGGGAPFTPAGPPPSLGLGAYLKPAAPPARLPLSPIAWATQHIATAGLGDVVVPPDPATPAVVGATVKTGVVGAAVLVAAVAVSLSAVAGFYAGKAMAPTERQRSMWGVYGAVSSVFTGWLGLGILGGVSLAQRNGL